MALNVKSWNSAHRGDLYTVVTCGKHKGTKLYPHKHEDGMYVVSPTRFERDYIRVPHIKDVPEWLGKGYRLRMSNSAAGVRAASLILPASISRETLE
jgi:hypothetical protein